MFSGLVLSVWIINHRRLLKVKHKKEMKNRISVCGHFPQKFLGREIFFFVCKCLQRHHMA